MKFPTPLKGWRAFAGEVGVIVLGVLLALGAQQLVADLQMRADVREFRRTIDHEIGLNLFVYQVRTHGSACNAKRMKELFDWLKVAPEGQPLPKISPAAPMALTPYTSAWDTRDGDVFAHVPAEARQKYAEFFDELEGNSERILWEVNEWFALERYALPGPVSLDDRRAIYGHLRKALILNAVWNDNMTISTKIADELGVKLVRPDNIPESFLSELKTCQSIFAPNKAGPDKASSPKS
jgi:hypothetical protein